MDCTFAWPYCEWFWTHDGGLGSTSFRFSGSDKCHPHCSLLVVFMIQKWFQKPWVWVVLVPLLVYVNSLGNGFTFDDHAIVEDNPSVLALDAAHVFSSPYWPNREHAGLYRPLTTLSLALNYAVHGFRPLGYHAVNVVLHVANSVLVFLLVGPLLRRPFAMWAALVFALHPIQTEAVNGIVGRAELLSAFWVLVACLLYVRSAVSRGGRLDGHYLMSLGASFLAMCSKENAVCLIGWLVVYDWVWVHRGRWPKGFAGFFKTGLPCYVPYLALIGLFLFIRTHVVGAILLPTPPAIFDTPLPHLAGLSRWLTVLAAAGVYFRLLVFPIWLSPDYSYGEIPIATSILDPAAWVPLGILLFVLGAVFTSLHRRQFLSGVLGLSFFAVAFAPVSNFVVIIGTILGERLLYLPMVGVALFVGSIASRRAFGAKPRALALAGVLLLGTMGVRTAARNADWHDDVTLFSAAIHDGNRSAKVYYNLGVGYRKQGRHPEALEAFEQLAQIKADDPDSWKYLGIAYAEQGLFARSLAAYARAVGLDSTRTDLWKRLGDVSVRQADWAGAEAAYAHVVSALPEDVDARYDLANACLQQGQTVLAIHHLEILLLKYDFDHQLATLLLSELYLETGRTTDARMLIQSATLRWPGDDRVKQLVAVGLHSGQ